jgi:hypothetical protein
MECWEKLGFHSFHCSITSVPQHSMDLAEINARRTMTIAAGYVRTCQ